MRNLQHPAKKTKPNFSDSNPMFALPCDGDNFLSTRASEIVVAIAQSKQLVRSHLGFSLVAPGDLRNNSHDLVLLRRRRKRWAFEDQFFYLAAMWKNILYGDVVVQIAGQDVVAGDRLQAAAAHACLFTDLLVPASPVEPGAPSFCPSSATVLRESFFPSSPRLSHFDCRVLFFLLSLKRL